MNKIKNAIFRAAVDSDDYAVVSKSFIKEYYEMKKQIENTKQTTIKKYILNVKLLI